MRIDGIFFNSFLFLNFMHKHLSYIAFSLVVILSVVSNFSSEGNLILPNNHIKKSHHDSWNGKSYKKEPVKRCSSLPSLVTQWTCVRCLLDNSCSSGIICIACDANSSTAETDKRRIGARKSKKLNLRKTNRLKAASELLANILDGFNATSSSTNDARIINKGMPLDQANNILRQSL